MARDKPLGKQMHTRHTRVANFIFSSPLDAPRYGKLHMEKLSLEDKAHENSDLDAAFLDYAKHESVDSLSLYEIESEILCLYDQLIELRLERAILETQLELPSGARKVS